MDVGALGCRTMVFSSHIFLYLFLPLALASYYAVPSRLRAPVFTVWSLVFYGWWRPQYVGLMLIPSVIDWVVGGRIARDRDRGATGRGWLVVSLCANLGLLAWFKYANFGVATLNEVLRTVGREPLAWEAVLLPVGISFYTFQTMSYTIDVYRGHVRPAERFVDFLCYVTMFPQLVAGPIVRYASIHDQLQTRTHTFGKFAQGVVLFQLGLAKKLLIADVVAHVANHAFDGAAPAPLDAWVGLVAYTFQIYFDFSGYSDMAIGLGLMFGFRFPVNFDQPYRSQSITEFWRRWHISLSSWLRDYLYVGLGGNRRGRWRTYLNLVITMLLGGLWHGASWNFVVWGAWHGAWLALERAMGSRSPLRFLPAPLRRVLTFVIIMTGWVFFRSATLDAALNYLGALVGVHTTGLEIEIRFIDLLMLGVAAVVTWALPTTQALLGRMSSWFVLVAQPTFALALLQLHFADHVPFLYFQF